MRDCRQHVCIPGPNLRFAAPVVGRPLDKRRPPVRAAGFRNLTLVPCVCGQSLALPDKPSAVGAEREADLRVKLG